jgi:hypothetical protein
MKIILITIFALISGLSCATQTVETCKVELLKASSDFVGQSNVVHGVEYLFSFKYGLECSRQEIEEQLTFHYETWKKENKYKTYEVLNDLPVKMMGNIRQIVLFK